eukprot:5165088-Amphidinium_carterae.1
MVPMVVLFACTDAHPKQLVRQQPLRAANTSSTVSMLESSRRELGRSREHPPPAKRPRFK